MNNTPEIQNSKLFNILSNKYKYGFETLLEIEKFPTGINKETIEKISKEKKEPIFLQKFRLKAYKKWLTMFFPNWSTLSIQKINYKNINIYSIPKNKNINNNNKIDSAILETFQKLGISLENKQNNKSNIAIDAVFDSISIAVVFQEKLAKNGIIFCSISEAIQNYPSLITKYLGTVVSSSDNFFAALNSAIFSDGSFCYIPQNTNCPLELSTYFRINNKNAGQFERTLIIAEKNSSVSYLEGCTAPEFKENQLHAAIVELVAFDNAIIKYSTVQNWYSGNNLGLGGVYNFVTKRGLCIGKNSTISWAQVETGSSITWKYPSCILLGEKSYGNFYSIALTNHYQQADTGTKMIHLGKNTNSKIISKGISAGNSKNTYRGLVKIYKTAKNARNYSQCDSILIGSNSFTNTYPYLDIKNSQTIIEHEAKISKISEDQLFYLQQRGFNLEQGMSLIINGLCKEIFNILPMEFALEANQLLSLKLEGTLG
jgi:Fe-S cluster assembly protein SufB